MNSNDLYKIAQEFLERNKEKSIDDELLQSDDTDEENRIIIWAPINEQSALTWATSEDSMPRFKQVDSELFR